MNTRAQHKRPESVLVVIYVPGGDILLLRRHFPKSFWQSVTGALHWDETPQEAAIRELWEETGLPARDLIDCQTKHRFEIYPMWRYRYAPGVVENVEHVFRLEVVATCNIVLDKQEHCEYGWFDCEEALRRITSHTNIDAVKQWACVGAQ